MSVGLFVTDKKFEEVYNQYFDMVYRICFLFLKNTVDTEDMVFNTFVRYLDNKIAFLNEEHEKVWFITTAFDICKDFMRHWWHKSVNLVFFYEAVNTEPKFDEIIEKIIMLPLKYKLAIYLYYYEGYTCGEIAKKLNKKETTIRTYIRRGRKRLKLELGGTIL